MARAAPPEAGDVWTWIAIDAESKLVISWLVSTGRGAGIAERFLSDVRWRLRNRVQITTDGWLAYSEAIERVFGSEVDYAHDIGYGTKRIIKGDPDPARISTTYVERHNLTTRMSLRRFARFSNGFSKRIANHAHAVSLYLTWYNFCRPHLSLGSYRTPAMAAGLTEYPYDMMWLASLLE